MSAEEERLLRSVALQNANSILKARLRAEQELIQAKEQLEATTSELREETRVLELLNRTGMAMASNLDLQRLVQTATAAATELSGANFGAFYLRAEGEQDGYQLSVFRLPEADYQRYGHPLVVRLLAGPSWIGELLRCDDVLAQPEYRGLEAYRTVAAQELPLRSFLLVPVTSRGGATLGYLFLGDSEPAAFSERSERLARGVAAQAAIALDNARLYDVAQRAAEERKELLERERSARAQAERASAMKDDFLATLSHELRTPLGAILGWAQLLRLRRPTAAELDQGIETIERNARVQHQLIEDLLDMSRITAGMLRIELQAVEPITVVEAALATVQPAAEAKDIRVRKRFDAAPSTVRGDPARLQQVVWNLLSNAIKFTPPGGTVHVTLERVDSSVQISVADSGVGIHRDFLPHVFDRFRQADGSTTRSFGGLGIGLSIVKSLVELHGGTVRVHSEGDGQGTTFTVLLPLSSVGRRSKGSYRSGSAASSSASRR